MNYLLVLSLLISSNIFGQSKKELRLLLEKSNSTVDSLSRELSVKTIALQKQKDSLQIIIDETQKRLNAQYQLTKSQEESINKCTSRNASLRSENEQLKESLRQTQSKTSTKTKKQSADPFFSGQGGSGNGNSFGVGKDNGEGGSGLGPGNNRKRLSDANVYSINSNEKGTVSLLLTIDSEGNVTKTTIQKEQTTITNQTILDQISACVKRDVKYQKDPNSKQMKVKYKVMID